MNTMLTHFPVWLSLQCLFSSVSCFYYFASLPIRCPTSLSMAHPHTHTTVLWNFGFILLIVNSNMKWTIFVCDLLVCEPEGQWSGNTFERGNKKKKTNVYVCATRIQKQLLMKWINQPFSVRRCYIVNIVLYIIYLYCFMCIYLVYIICT